MSERKPTRFELRLPPDMGDAIDAWRRTQNDIPARAEAARRLVEVGLTLPAHLRSLLDKLRLDCETLAALTDGRIGSNEKRADGVQVDTTVESVERMRRFITSIEDALTISGFPLTDTKP